MTLQTVILAAGMGSRLGRSLPKPLTELSDGRSIMQQQHDNIRAAFGTDARITTVVGLQGRDHRRGVPRGRLRLQRPVRPDQHLQEPAARPHQERQGRRALDERRRRVRPAGPRPRDRAHRARSVVRHRQHLEGERRRGQVHGHGRGLHQRALQDRQGRHRRGGRHQLHLERRQEGVHPPAVARRRPGLLRARPRARDRRGRRAAQPLDISDLYAVEVDFAEDLERANLFV